MADLVDGLAIRKRLGREIWSPPAPFGPDGYHYLTTTEPPRAAIIVTGWHHDGVGWLHASMSRTDQVPSYDDLMHLHRAVWGPTGYSYQVFAPPDKHVNVHEYCLHLWGRADGSPRLPDFAMYRTI